MANPFYTRTFDVVPGTRVGSQAIEDQFELLEQGLDILPTPQQLYAGQGNAAVAGGAADVYTLALNANVVALTNLVTVTVDFPTALANLTTTPTINVNSLGAKSIVRQNGSAVAIGDLTGTVILSYNTTAGKFLQVSGAGLASEAASAASAAASEVSRLASGVSATASAVSAAAAAASYDSFDDRYLGPKAVAPTLDNDGGALLTGALYYDTVIPGMQVYTGSAWTASFITYTAASQAEMETGTEVALRSMSPLRVKQAVEALVPFATQAEQETGSSTVKVVTSGRQHFHPSAAKVWLQCGITGNILASYNVTSITDSGAGQVTVTIATDFSSGNYAALGSINGSDLTLNVAASAAGTIVGVSRNLSGATTDPGAWAFAAFGDQ